MDFYVNKLCSLGIPACNAAYIVADFVKNYRGVKELEEYIESLGSIEKITHSMKSIACIMDMGGSSGRYSNRYSNRYPANNYSGEYSNDMRGNSQRYSNREYSGTYSNDYSGNSLREHLEHAMKDATDDRMRDEIRRLMNRI